MLIEMKVKNFRSFRDEIIFSMVASSDKSLIENTIETKSFGDKKLLRSAVIYGANGAGKSNIIYAARFIDQFVNTSAEKKIDEPIEVSPFLFSGDTQNLPSEFEITFLGKSNIRYQYGFQVTQKMVVKEWLIAYPKGLPQLWFERNQGTDILDTVWNFGRNLKGKNNQIAEMTRPDVLYLSNAAKLNHNQIREVYNWFAFDLRTIQPSEMDFILKNLSAKLTMKDNLIKNRTISFLNVADLGIDNFQVEEKTYQEKDLPNDMPTKIRDELINKKHLEIYMHHNIPGNDNCVLPIEEESEGTQRYFSLSGPLSQVLENGYTLFIDELDSSLHPLLVRYLVGLFNDPKANQNGAQLIFNTHDTTLMDSCLFRRDQIWFVEKDREGISHLYSLLDYSPRKGEALAKGYLSGRYGAIPFLGEPLWGKIVEDEENK